MGSIYGGALLTVVAGAGDSVHAGLPGINSSRRRKPIVKLDNIVLLADSCDPGYPLDNTVWNTRGWTFQEQLLSHKLLVFLEDQVYWQCKESEFLEAMDLDHLNKALIWESQGNVSETKLALTVENYNEIVEKYTKRRLTHDADIHKALGGILAVIPDKFTWAIPESQFVQMLCWQAEDAVNMPRRLDPSAPSWSWLGWNGPICSRKNPSTPSIECYVWEKGMILWGVGVGVAPVSPWGKKVVREDVPSYVPDDGKHLLFWARTTRLGVWRKNTGLPTLTQDGRRGLQNVGVLYRAAKDLTEDGAVYDFIVLAEYRPKSGGQIYLLLMVSWRGGISYREYLAWTNPSCGLIKLEVQRKLIVLG